MADYQRLLSRAVRRRNTLLDLTMRDRGRENSNEEQRAGASATCARATCASAPCVRHAPSRTAVAPLAGRGQRARAVSHTTSWPALIK